MTFDFFASTLALAHPTESVIRFYDHGNLGWTRHVKEIGKIICLEDKCLVISRKTIMVHTFNEVTKYNIEDSPKFVKSSSTLAVIKSDAAKKKHKILCFTKKGMKSVSVTTESP